MLISPFECLVIFRGIDRRYDTEIYSFRRQMFDFMSKEHLYHGIKLIVQSLVSKKDPRKVKVKMANDGCTYYL